MKTLKLKIFIATGVVSTFFVLTSALPPGNEAPTSSPNGRFEKENIDIRHDISNINMHKDRIQSLKEEYKADKKAYKDSKSADKKMEMIADKKELKKTRADLKRDKQYLKADKKDLKCDHKLVLSERRKEIREDRQAIRESKRALNREIANGNETSAQTHLTRVVRLQNELNNDEMALKRERTDMDENLSAVNKAIRNSDSRSDNGTIFSRNNNSTSGSGSSKSR